MPGKCAAALLLHVNRLATCAAWLPSTGNRAEPATCVVDQNIQGLMLLLKLASLLGGEGANGLLVCQVKPAQSHQTLPSIHLAGEHN
jgi:hypothetical protein